MNQSSYGDFESRRTGGLWNALNRLMIVAIIVALCVAAGLAFVPLFKQRGEESARIEQLQDSIAKQKIVLARETRKADLLKNDPDYLEMIARDRLDMMKPGETIIRLEPARSRVSIGSGPVKN